MASILKPFCGAVCQEETEFSLKFVITSLTLTDDDEIDGFEDVLLVITFDGHVIKIDKFVTDEDGGIIPLGRGVDLMLSPEQFVEKIRTKPIMLNLSRGLTDLGTHKLNISDCFIDAVMCQEFSSEKFTTDLNFIDDQENATMTLVLQASRKVEQKVASKKLKKPSAPKETNEVSQTESFLSTTCSDISFSCSTDRDPLDDEEAEKRLMADIFRPMSYEKSKSTRSKCLSDIATSLNIRDCSDNKQTFCNGCGQFSLSGVTCDDDKLSIKSLLKPPCKSMLNVPCKFEENKNTQNCKNRVCSECFEDLSVIPGNTPCPKCIFRTQLQRKLVSFKSKKVKTQENRKVRDCIKSIIEEIFFDAKDRLLEDWQRLKRKPKKKSKILKKEERRSSEMNTKSMPR